MLMRALSVHIAHEIAGAARIRHSLRPLTTRGRANDLQTSGALRREIAKVYPPSLRAKRSNPCLLPCGAMDCFASLAMTRIGRGVLGPPLSRRTTAVGGAAPFEGIGFGNFNGYYWVWLCYRRAGWT